MCVFSAYSLGTCPSVIDDHFRNTHIYLAGTIRSVMIKGASSFRKACLCSISVVVCVYLCCCDVHKHVANLISKLSLLVFLVLFTLALTFFFSFTYMKLTNHVQVNKKRRVYGGSMSTSSSVYSTYSDSGVGGDWATSGLVTPIHDHTQAYVNGQSMLNRILPTRQKEAQAAAIALISNSPQPDMLNPQVPRSMHHHHGERQRRNHLVRNFPGAYSSDDSSSCFTMTSQSSTSEALFVPRKTTQSVYTESDEPHYPHHQR